MSPRASPRSNDGTRDLQFGGGLLFTPHGSWLIFTGGSYSGPMLRIVPVAGGKSTLVIGLSEGLTDTGNGSLSPGGSLLTFVGGGSFESGHCEPRQFVANADGTEMRVSSLLQLEPCGNLVP